MAISASTIANYAPWGNAQLAFEVGGAALTTDPDTGNTTQNIEIVEYLAALNLEAPSWDGQPGADNSTYRCTGRLLSPDRLDTRITNGSQAEAIINGYRGRFELVFDLAMDTAAYRDIRQSIQGTFRVIGGAING
jgi:hypothetical protein